MKRAQLNSWRMRIAGVVLFCVLIVLSQTMSHRRAYSQSVSVATGAFAKRSAAYCNNRDKDAITGEEGKLPAQLPGARLQGVVLSVRHGDRSAIHMIPNAVSDPVFECGDVPSWPRHTAVRSETTGARLAAREVTSAARDGGACLPGQLTARGARQLRAVGRHLHAQYGPMLDVGNYTARSTDYTRTLASAAFFLEEWAELVPGARQEPSERHTVAVYEDEKLEIMHGVGIASVSAGKVGFDQRDGDKQVSRGCGKAVALGAEQAASFKIPPSTQMKKELATLFGREAADKSITDLGDAIHAGSCHSLPLPCGSAGCLSSGAAAEILAWSDRNFCERYTGAAGGHRATRLALYPFLRTIADSLQAVADGHAYGRPVKLFFGHDTVIAPVLAALGVFDCKWPPYASRLAFELWRLESDGSYQVRILYNGVPVTRRVRGCDGQDPCPLGRFRRVVQGLIHPAETIEDACVS
eukprot:TRINITY_DN12951_c0_g1_i1.p1 TRINITY_DN12951_c0_g1~~TRINITY_DN12951_c0_g1_i1.p1  ORF type:complete len:469 (+),score=100.85 TRINITY_DN12951_c0_g1_i1:95-1501(+)